MQKRYTIRDEAKAEVTEIHGELAALSVYVEIDRNRSYRIFAPIGATGEVVGSGISFFEDQIEEA